MMSGWLPSHRAAQPENDAHGERPRCRHEFLLYIAVAFPQMVLLNRASTGEGTAAKVSQIAQHASEMRIAILLASSFAAFVLAVTLYAITRDEDQDLALLALTCRVAEGVTGAFGTLSSVALLWLATNGRNATDNAGVNTIGALLLRLQDWSPTIGATFFVVGSTLFAYLFLRGRLIPSVLAWLGVIVSVMFVVVLPLQLAGYVRGASIAFLRLPMLAFEVTLGLWLIIKGVRPVAA